MKILHISVLDKKATYLNRDGDIVCGNSDYVIEFAFDAEWDAHEEKIARFIWNDRYTDVKFTGTRCPVPIITNTSAVEVGVYAGELSTTTPAIIGCQKSILCQGSAPGGTPFTKGEKGDPGTTSWNGLEDRPFGEEPGEIQVDRSDSAKYKVSVHFHETWTNIDYFTKVSEDTPTLTELIGGVCTTEQPFGIDFETGGIPTYTSTINASWVKHHVENEILVLSNKIAVCYKENAIYNDKAFPEVGMYFGYFGETMMTHLVYTGTCIKKLDKKYLPEIPNIETPTNSKYVMQDNKGNLAATSLVYTQYPNLAYRYTYNGNQEIHPTDVDLATGIFTAPAHGVKDKAQVLATMNPPYHIGEPYSFLPYGLMLGGTGNTSTGQIYVFRLIDEDHFAISLSATQDYQTFTEPTSLDFSKFHFEVVTPAVQELRIEGLDVQECLLVVKGRFYNYFKQLRPTNRVDFNDKTGGICYDAAFGTDQYGSCYFGRPGYNYMHAAIECSILGDRHALQVHNTDFVMYAQDNKPTFRHNRQYFHMLLSSNTIEGMMLGGGGNVAMYNGTTLEVYVK